MSRHIAIVSATTKEIQPLLDYLKAEASQHEFQTYKLHALTIDIIYSGIGILQTTYNLMDYLSHRHPDAWIQAGIGGAFDHSLNIGDVYQIESEVLVEFGAEDFDGRIIDPFELGWNDPNGFPYTEGKLICPFINEKFELPIASGMTSIHAHGFPPHIEQLRTGINGQIENMEGAVFFYISLIKKIPFLSLRSVSNFVEARDTKKWNFGLSLKNLNDTIIGIIKSEKIPHAI
ncbi:MAG: hypothetical protein IPP15_17965 [Saprospiraceae bacterium]|uniref:Futalosine hydrolase n=1 Tax=Candidatus Opimibacter skivensis TaxID=2982028 RepID=A0A9D7SVZ2_9BACT|nr:hypothetical protein [Candidatus Opimibacter skivensis]